jgi:hypothetical protein
MAHPDRPLCAAQLRHGAGYYPEAIHTCADWKRRGALDPDLHPATLARGYRLAHGGRQPARDPRHRHSFRYSETELEAAMAALDLPTPAERLGLIWQVVLQRVTSPSTRMLLSLEVRLMALGGGQAWLDVPKPWLPMVTSRCRLVDAALTSYCGSPVTARLRAVFP